jgi:D-amino-acid dehydrogenase
MPTVPPGTAAPRSDPDVLVVGAGIVGLFCAYYLRRGGASVTVTERGPIGGSQSCSYGNTGFVGTQGSVPLAEPGVPAQGLRWLLNPQSPFYIKPRLDPDLLRWLWLFRRACTEEKAKAGYAVLLELKKRSLQILREVCASGPLADSFVTPGLLVACKTPEEFQKVSRSVPRAIASGVPMRILSPADLAELEPDTAFDIAGAVCNDEGAALHVPEFVTELGRELARIGVQFCPDTEVTGFDAGSASAGRSIRQVRTSRGDFRPGEVVIAAGAWSAACVRQLGVRLQLQPAKGYSVTVKPAHGGPRRPVLLSEGKVALMPLGDRLRIGGTLELSGLDSAVSARRVAGIMATVREFLPGLDTGETLETWSGFRPCSPDGVPYLGRAESYRNLTIACGHGHVGMGLAPASGELIAQLVAGQPTDFDPAPFRIGRYRGRALRGGALRGGTLRGRNRASAAVPQIGQLGGELT